MHHRSFLYRRSESLMLHMLTCWAHEASCIKECGLSMTIFVCMTSVLLNCRYVCIYKVTALFVSKKIYTMKWRVPGQDVDQRKLGERLWKKTVRHVKWTTIGVSGWMLLLVPAHPGWPGQNPESRKMVMCVCVCVFEANYKHIGSCCFWGRMVLAVAASAIVCTLWRCSLGLVWTLDCIINRQTCLYSDAKLGRDANKDTSVVLIRLKCVLLTQHRPSI